MQSIIASAAISLLRREEARLIAATGLIFQGLVSEQATDTKSISSVLQSQRGGIWGNEASEFDGVPVLRSTNMRGAQVDVASPAWVQVSDKDIKRCALETGDILVTKSSGSPDLVGKAALFVHPGNEKDYLFSNFVLRLRPDKTVVEPEYLAWFLRSPQSLAWRFDSQQNAVGLRNLQTRQFLEQAIPVPDIRTQQFIVEYLHHMEENKVVNDNLDICGLAGVSPIVAKIEALTSKVDEVKRLREEILTDAQAMLHSSFQAIIEGAEYSPMAEVAPIVRRKVEIDMDGEYPELGARSFGKGIFHKPTLIGAELDWQKLYRVQEGDLVISNIKAWEGAIAVASRNDHDRVGSHRYITCVPKEGLATSNFLCFYLLTEAGLEKVQAASPGSADRNRTLAMKRLEKSKSRSPITSNSFGSIACRQK